MGVKMDNGIKTQSSLFSDSSLIDLSNGWKLEVNPETTAQNQILIFDVPGAKAAHHTGQKSTWLINGIKRRASYVRGDDSRKPPKKIIEQGCELLKELTDSGRLFPGITWEQLLSDDKNSRG